jgi:hypothetical protein
MMTTTTSTSPTERKALATRIREAAAEAGLAIAIVGDPSGYGRLMYSIAGCKPLTPGEAAEVLGVSW